MKKNYEVIITETREIHHYIKDVNSPEEAESIAESEYNAECEALESVRDGEIDILDSQVTDVIPEENEELSN